VARKKKSKAQLETELRLVRRGRTVDALAAVAKDALRWGGIVLCFYFLYRSVAVLSGKTTFADIGIRVLANLRVSEAAAWIFGASGVGYGVRQRSLRRSTIERLSGRIQELERGIDPRRSSSDLTPRGETPPEDL
jgi:hypothetical protein